MSENRGAKGDKGDKGERGEGMTRGARRAIVMLFALMVALAVAALLFTAHAVNADDHKWCAAMTLLTSRPVPKPAHPAANPSRQQAYQLYRTFVELRHNLGCG